MTTAKVRTFTREELEILTPAQIAEAIAALDIVMPDADAEPKNLQQVVGRADPYGSDFGVETTVRIFKEAGCWPIYHRHTGVSSIIMKNLLPAKLVERDDRGRLVWTTNFKDIPEGLPHKSTFPCWLNPKHDLNDTARAMGFSECKQMSPTAMDAEFHTKKKHGRAYAAFEKETLRTKEAKTAEWQDTSMTAITTAALGTQVPMQSEAVCVGCGESFFALNIEAVQTKLAVHTRSCGTYGDVSIQSEGASATFVPGFVPEVNDVPIPGPNPPAKPMIAKSCPHCDFISEASSHVGAGSRLKGHIRKEHPDAD